MGLDTSVQRRLAGHGSNDYILAPHEDIQEWLNQKVARLKFVGLGMSTAKLKKDFQLAVKDATLRRLVELQQKKEQESKQLIAEYTVGLASLLDMSLQQVAELIANYKP